MIDSEESENEILKRNQFNGNGCKNKFESLQQELRKLKQLLKDKSTIKQEKQKLQSLNIKSITAKLIKANKIIHKNPIINTRNMHNGSKTKLRSIISKTKVRKIGRMKQKLGKDKNN